MVLWCCIVVGCVLFTCAHVLEGGGGNDADCVVIKYFVINEK